MAIGTALAIVGAGVALHGGIQVNRQSKKQARQLQAETAEQMAQREKDVAKFVQEQQYGFLSSGVTLQGSPLLVLKETREEGAADVENMRKAGDARYQSVRAQGRSAFFQGITSAIGMGAQAYGAYDPSKTTSIKPAYTGGFSDTSRFGGVA